MMTGSGAQRFCGQIVSGQQMADIAELVDTFGHLSRNELANTVCELLGWQRANGRLKAIECRQFLEALDAKGVIALPAVRPCRPGKQTARPPGGALQGMPDAICAALAELGQVQLVEVATAADRSRWCAYVDQHHYLGYRQAFGARLGYFIRAGGKDLGCIQFSSAAWKMACRDRWIGWSDAQRRCHLQKVVNNSRFLIFPWVKVAHLASHVLALAARVIKAHWFQAFGVQPVLLETLVDQARFSGTCYRAANWQHVGQTAGRGRMDACHQRHGMAPKAVFVYPLDKRFRQWLCG
jgi:hypothetical protein